MPEGPEVRIVANWLSFYVGSTLFRTEPFRNGCLELPATLVEVKCVGKKILLVFDEFALKVKLGLYGSFTTSPTRYTRDTLVFDKVSIYFNDRMKATALVHTSVEDGKNWILDSGYDILTLSRQGDIGVVIKVLTLLISSHGRKNICAFLLDQSLFSGIGNYMKSDILYIAQISPYKTMEQLTSEEIVALGESMAVVAASSYSRGGITGYNRPDGQPGAYFPIIYQKAAVEEGPVRYVKIGGRGTYYSPAVQER